MQAAITLFTYARIGHTQRTVEALIRNTGANAHDLIVYSDAPRTQDKVQAVADVRYYLQTITGFRSVTIRHRPHNYGLAKSIIEGVTEVLSHYEQIIVLEDDMVTSPHFLTYMNEGLERFANDDRVISVHGYSYPVQQTLPDAFFLRGADCWGWGTWRRGWKLFEPNGAKLFADITEKGIANQFDFNGSYGFTEMLRRQIMGKNDSWAVRWYASAFLANKLTLYPGRSLVHNIGTDSTGTHCDDDRTHDVILSKSPINFSEIIVEESMLARGSFETFFINSQPSLKIKIQRWLKNMGKKLNDQLKN